MYDHGSENVCVDDHSGGEHSYSLMSDKTTVVHQLSSHRKKADQF